MSASIKKILLFVIIGIVVIGVGVSLFFILRQGAKPSEPVDVIIDSSAEYVIIYGANTATGGKLAYTFKNTFKDAAGNFDMTPDTEEEKKLEILMGETNRSLSATLKSEAHKNALEDSHVYGFAYENGKLAIYASNGGIALERAMSLFAEKYYKNGIITFKSDLFEVFEYTRAEQDAAIKAEEERIEAEKKAERAEKTKEYKLLVDSFSNLKFGSITETLGNDYDAPPVSPTKGEHPRLLINSVLLEELRTVIDTEECSAAKNAFFELALTETDGKLPAATVHETGRKGEHNYDNKLLGIIQAKALAYLLTGEEYYGYGAILAMKNYILTLDIKWIHSDQCREFGYVMYNAALVYDWCYPLLTDNDKHQLIAGIENYICKGTTENTVDSTYGGVKMEIGFPPSKEGAVSGHGTEMQLLRDYLSFSVAIFDEYPDWWEYIGGRFYQEFVPVRNEFFKSGFYPQGTATYAPWRHMGDLWAAWIVMSFGADSPYDGDVAQVVRTFFAHETYGNAMFGTGDGNNIKFSGNFSGCALIASALYNDPSLRAWSKHLGSGFNTFSYGVANVTPAEMLILSSRGTKTASDRYEGFDNVHYNSSPLGQMIVRKIYNDVESAVVLMKIGERTTANHSHQSSGTFQIYYKGMLSGDSGVYDKYGSDHHYYYHQATVSHNGLLVYNPAFASSNKGWYTGGQRKVGESSSLNNWMADRYVMGEVIGVSYGYANDNKTPTYAYLAGDITSAYDSATVDHVSRRMLTVYTNDKDIPMLMAVYDSIDSDSASFTKTFLLQAPTEPTVENGRVTIVNGEGKLTLVTVKGADNITAIGGEDKNYFINDKQLAPSKTAGAETWGRVEITQKGTKESEFLNLMYVSDAESQKSLAVAAIADNDYVTGLCADGICAAFVKSHERSEENISFTSTGEGTVRYFISGVVDGEWFVSINGGERFSVKADKDGGILVFEGESGEVSVSREKDPAPDNAYAITYNLNGGVLTNAPKYHYAGEVTVLPTPVSEDGSIFLGWFTDSEFTQPITEISATTKEKVRVYAKWKSVYTTDFSKSSLNASESNVSYGLLLLQLNTKVGATVKTETAGGETFAVWTKGDNDPAVNDNSNLTGIIGDTNKVTFRLTLAKSSSKSTFATNFRLRGYEVGDLKSNQNVVSVFMTDDNGNVKLSNTDKVIVSLTEKLTEFSVTVDFENGTMTAYDREGNEICSAAFSPRTESGAANALEWKDQLTGYAYNWYGGMNRNSESDSCLRIGEITYYSGGFIKR